MSEPHFRVLVERAPDGVVILVNGKITYINPVAVRLLGADPATAIGSSILDYLPPEDARLTMARIGEMFKTGQDVAPNEYRVIADPKRVVEIKSMLVEWDGARAVIAYARDVTERKTMQDKLIATDRFTALGKLAAGVAHEITNPLTYVHASVELIELKLKEAGITGYEDILADAMHGLDRIANITKDLRTFARSDRSPSTTADVVPAVEQALRMVDNELRHRAKLVRRFATDIPEVIGSQSRLEQVFVNLLINAVHALGSPETDEIVVELAREGDTMIARVTDSGHGIPEDIISRVFDPFFTTKPVGIGMGLGLSVCKNLVEADGGSISIASTLGRGTTVTIVLPIAPGAKVVDAPPTPPAEVDRPRRRVLIVDDEPFIRETLSVLLSMHHDVRTADGGLAAIAEIEAHPVDVVLCDVMMPGMNGMELHRRVAAQHAGLERRFVFVTGGAFQPELISFLGSVGNRCLAKPFKIEQILAAIGEVA